MKKRIRIMLNFSQLEKSNIPTNMRGQLPIFVKNIQNVLHPYGRKKVQMGDAHRMPLSDFTSLPECVTILSVKNTWYKLKTPVADCACNTSIQRKELNVFSLCYFQLRWEVLKKLIRGRKCFSR
jgi:hypothetical protein